MADFPQQDLNKGIPAGLLDGTGVPVSPWATNPISSVKDPAVDPRDLLDARVNRFVPGSLSGPIRSSGAEAERYVGQEFGFLPSSIRDNEDFYAQYQSGMEKIGKGLLKLPLYTITKLGSGVGFVAGMANPVNWFSEEGYISSVADNSFSGFFDNWEQDIKNQWLPTFQEAEDREKGFFSRAATDIDFWTEDFVDGLAFMASAWVPGMALSKAGMGAKAIRALSKFGATGAESVGGSIEAVAASTNYFKNAAKYAQTLDKFNSWAIATSSEAMFEAKGVKDAIMLSLENSSLTEPQKKQIAGDNARNAFLMNAALLGVTNIFELPLVSKMLNKTEGVAAGISGATKLGENAAVKQATSKAGKFLESGYGRFAKDATSGIFREGFIEENGQLAIQRFNEQYGAAGKVADMLDFNTYAELGGNYLKQTYGALSGDDTEAATSIGLGGILGGGMTAIGNARQAPKNKLSTEEAVEYYNKAQESWLKFGNIYQTEQAVSKDENGNDVITEKIKLDENNQPVLDQTKLAAVASSVRSNAAAIDLSDGDTNLTRRNLMRDNAFADFVQAHINANMEDALMNKLDAITRTSPEDMAKLGFVADDTLAQQVARYKGLAASIIKQNKIINSDIMFDGSKEDNARKSRLTELAAQQAVYKGLVVDEQRKYDEIRNEAVNDQDTSLTDGIVDQLNAIKLRISSQEQYIKELKASSENLTKSQVKIAQSLLDNLKDQLTTLEKNNELSVKNLKTFNNGLYQYEKEARNNGAFLNPMLKRMKYKGELDNHIETLGKEWGNYADFENGKKNFLDMFIDQQIKGPVNEIIEKENAEAAAAATPTPPPAGPTEQTPTPTPEDDLDESKTYLYNGNTYSILVLGDSVSMLNIKSADEKDNAFFTVEEFKKALQNGTVSIVQQAAPVQKTTDEPANLDEFLEQEYAKVKKASEAQKVKLASFEEWKKTTGPVLTRLWVRKQLEKGKGSSTSSTPVSDVEAKKADIERRRKEELYTTPIADGTAFTYSDTPQAKAINAKYDAELAALEGGQPVQEVKEEQAPASTLEKELADLNKQLNNDLGDGRELRFMKAGSIGYDNEGNKYQVVSKKDKYGRSLEYRVNDGKEQSFNPLTASQQSNSMHYYRDAFVKLYSKNPKPLFDKFEKDKAAIEEKYKTPVVQQVGTEVVEQEEDTSKDVKDFVQDINKYRTQSYQNNELANADFQVGFRQVAPSNSLANATDLVEVVEFAPNQIRYERGEVNSNYVFDVATNTFMPGHRVTFKVMVDGFEPVVNRLTGEVYEKSSLYDDDWNVVQDKYDHVPIGVFANIRGKEVMIGTIHEPQWIAYKIGNKFPHIAIPTEQMEQAVPAVVVEEVNKNRQLRKLILDKYNQNHNFVIEGVVQEKSMGILRTTESVEPISKRVNPRIAEGGTDNRHGMFAIVKDGMFQSDRNVEIDNVVPTDSFSADNMANYQGVTVLMLPTPTGQWFPSFIKLPNVTTEQSEFIIEAWKAFTGQTNNPEIVKAVYDAMGLSQSSDGFGVGVLRDYIDHYITVLNTDKLSRVGNGSDVRPGSARLNITNKGGLELQVKDANGNWFSTAEPIMKAEQLPVDYLEKMTNLRTTVKLSSLRNDSLKGINSTEQSTILSMKNGKLVKQNIMYNQYVMDRAGTFVDKGVQSKNTFGDWVYFANPVLKMGVINTPVDQVTAASEVVTPAPVPTVEQVNTPREDKGAALLAALKAKKLQESQMEEQKKNCSSLRSKLDNIM